MDVLPPTAPECLNWAVAPANGCVLYKLSFSNELVSHDRHEKFEWVCEIRDILGQVRCFNFFNKSESCVRFWKWICMIQKTFLRYVLMLSYFFYFHNPEKFVSLLNMWNVGFFFGKIKSYVDSYDALIFQVS